MIEMRWVERDAVFMSNGVVPAPTTERVLQYRKWSIYVRVSDGAVFSDGDWSDWQDVPTVAEGA